MSANVIRARSRKHLSDVVQHIRDPLYRNGYALILNTVATSGLGMVYWVVVARLYEAGDVGRGSAFISAIVFISGVSQLNLRPVLGRFIPVAGQSSRMLVASSYLVVCLVSVVAGFIFVGVVNIIGGPDVFGAVSGSPELAVAFVLIVALWCVFSLQDGVLIGLRRASWVLIENSLFGIFKILIVFGSILVFGSSALGIVGSWVIPMMLAVVLVNAYVFRRWIPEHLIRYPETSDLVTRRRIARFAAGDYLGSLFAIAYASLLPIIIIAQTDPETSAHFYIVWIIATAIQLIPLQMVVSLVVETSSDPDGFHRRARDMVVQMLRILGPVCLGIILAAPLILTVFGDTYAERGAPLLRILVLAIAPFTVNVLYFGYMRVRAETTGIVIGQAALALSILGLTAVLLPSLGLVGVGLAYLIGQSVVACVVASTSLRPLFRAHARRPSQP